MKQLILHLPDNIYHRLEVLAAKDNDRITDGVAKLLTYLITEFEGRKYDKR